MALPKLLQSSADPEKLALSLRAGVPFVLLLLPLIGVVDVSESELLELINAGAALVAGALTFFALARKLVLKFKK